jgi:DNA-binding protein YbaB
MPDVKALEVSYEQEVVFVGGGKDDDDGVAKLVAVSFEADARVLAEVEIKPREMNCVYCLRRLEEGNVLFVGGYCSLVVVFYDEEKRQFVHLRAFEDLMSEEIADIRFFDNSLYIVSPAHEELVKIVFSGLKELREIEMNRKTEQDEELGMLFDQFGEQENKLEGNLVFVTIFRTI